MTDLASVHYLSLTSLRFYLHHIENTLRHWRTPSWSELLPQRISAMSSLLLFPEKMNRCNYKYRLHFQSLSYFKWLDQKVTRYHWVIGGWGELNYRNKISGDYFPLMFNFPPYNCRHEQFRTQFWKRHFIQMSHNTSFSGQGRALTFENHPRLLFPSVCSSQDLL